MITIKFKTNEKEEFDLDSLDMVNFDESQFHTAIFSGLSLYKTSFIKANLRSAELSRCYLDRAVFVEALLMNANLTYSVLTGADFSYSKLSGACFFKADVRNANFIHADLFGAKFNDADLRGTDFSDALRIDSASFDNALYDDKTIWPENFSTDLKRLILVQQSLFTGMAVLLLNCSMVALGNYE